MIYDFFTSEHFYETFFKVLRIILIVAIGFPLIHFLSKQSKKLLKSHATPQLHLIISKIIYYLGLALIAISVLSELGFNLSALLGAAGVAGIAVGFAAQTSITNIISGIFLLSEQFVRIGDYIQISNADGTVESIDLFSIKIRTSDNQLVRIPNEYLIKNTLKNVTYYPERRYDFNVRLNHDQNLTKALNLLKDTIKKNRYSLQTKEPLIVFNEFKDSYLNIFVGAWAKTSDYSNFKKTVLVDIKNGFEDAGIQIPVPIVSVSMQK